MVPVNDEQADAVSALLGGTGDGAIFDGEGFDGGAALVACRPRAVLEGGWEDWGILEQALADGRRHNADGGLAGWFDYEGNFRFGVFPAWERRPRALPPVPAGPFDARFVPSMSRDEWVRRVGRILDYIAAGDIYQINLTHTMTARWPGSAGAFYPRLRAASPAPYACFVRLGDTSVLSASPECFLRIDGREISTRPIKGTRARRADPGDDAAAVRELLGSAKERAELVMITDLERNDLGQICDYGTVRVASLCELHTFAQVHHLVSTVTGKLRATVAPVEAVRACFPGGSITGAPKKRAREIIAELEPGPRGIYTGAIGYFTWDGRAVFNIAIRTLVVRGDRAEFGVGAGIVADSDPVPEYEETLHKAAGLFAALDGAR